MKCTLMEIRFVTIVASIAFVEPIRTITEEYNLPSKNLRKRP